MASDKKLLGKSDIISYISSSSDVSKKDADLCLDLFLKFIGESLKSGSSVGINRFGTFKVSERKARKGRNPKTGEELLIPASYSVNFKVSNGLKDLLNGK